MMTGGWRKLHNEELHDLYCPPSIIRTTKLRRVRCEGNVARMGRRGIDIGYWWESRKRIGHYEVDNIGWIILGCNWER
jgi:hypothetical protein